MIGTEIDSSPNNWSFVQIAFVGISFNNEITSVFRAYVVFYRTNQSLDTLLDSSWSPIYIMVLKTFGIHTALNNRFREKAILIIANFLQQAIVEAINECITCSSLFETFKKSAINAKISQLLPICFNGRNMIYLRSTAKMVSRTSKIFFTCLSEIMPLFL